MRIAAIAEKAAALLSSRRRHRAADLSFRE